MKSTFRLAIIEENELIARGVMTLVSHFETDIDVTFFTCVEKFTSFSSAFDLVIVEPKISERFDLNSVFSLTQIDKVSTIVLSSEENPKVIEACLDLEILAYVLKHQASNKIPSLLEQVINLKNNRQTPSKLNVLKTGSKKSSLTHRQQQVLDKVALGKTNKEIARELIISDSTVKAHLACIFRSLGVKNRTQALTVLLP